MESIEDRSYLITGGAGFIGSNFVLNWLDRKRKGSLIILDKLTYAGHRLNLKKIEENSQHHFFQGDISNNELVKRILETYNPVGVVHFAAETHVDRSIQTALPFAETNVLGTCALLETVKNHWNLLDPQSKANFRFIHISTDEVYGSLGTSDPPTIEGSPYRPNSPYAASKAASDHFVRSFYKTYGLPIIITHSTNNFGPRQFPEKLPEWEYGDGWEARKVNSAGFLHLDGRKHFLGEAFADQVIGIKHSSKPDILKVSYYGFLVARYSFKERLFVSKKIYRLQED